ncbi:MAG TPA: 3-ketoacyl-ACP reductase [Planctomycetota bacterium]|nr:3-ketoacyl-ACP reductase [Planctomycetota bacterium]
MSNDTKIASAPAALVTGASRGIGRGIAIALGKIGWRVGVNYSSHKGAAEETVALIRTAGGTAEAVQGDVANSSQRKFMVDFTLSKFRRLDALVNNAGVAPEARDDLLDATENAYDRVMNVNLKGPYFLSQLAAREMIAQIKSGAIERGFIVNISSVSGYAVSINRGEYCISKAGMGMMTQLFAARLAHEKIFVHEIRPGVIATDMTGPVKEKYDKLIGEGLSPIQRWGQPEDVGACVAAILSGAFPFSTGQVFDVDGGYHIRRL